MTKLSQSIGKDTRNPAKNRRERTRERTQQRREQQKARCNPAPRHKAPHSG
nr:MAG TPA: hypothetical protein [Caudoviricetes sp.]